MDGTIALAIDGEAMGEQASNASPQGLAAPVKPTPRREQNRSQQHGEEEDERTCGTPHELLQSDRRDDVAAPSIPPRSEAEGDPSQAPRVLMEVSAETKTEPPDGPLQEERDASDANSTSEQEQEREQEHEEDAVSSTSDGFVQVPESAGGHEEEEDDREQEEDEEEDAADAAEMSPHAAVWVQYRADNGHDYFYNTHTRESRWTRPPEMLTLSSGTSTSIVHHDAASTGKQFTSADLFLAVMGTPPMAVRLAEICNAGVDVNVVNADGFSPLHLAVQRESLADTELLLEHGALVDAQVVTPQDTSEYEGDTALILASRLENVAIMRLLLRYGAAMEATDQHGNTMLHLALHAENDEMLFFVLGLEQIADIVNLANVDNETPLHLATRLGHPGAVKALLVRGASREAEDALGRTPLVVSIMEKNDECAHILQHADKRPTTAQYIGTPPGSPFLMSIPEESEAMSADVDRIEELQLAVLGVLREIHHDALTATVSEYMESVQRQVAVMATALETAEKTEEKRAIQVDLLTKNHEAATNELIRERQQATMLRREMDERQLQFTTMKTMYSSLETRAAVLESIARTAQEKLGRERIEHRAQEEYWQATIDRVLGENASLQQAIVAIQSLGGSALLPPPAPANMPPASAVDAYASQYTGDSAAYTAHADDSASTWTDPASHSQQQVDSEIRPPSFVISEPSAYPTQSQSQHQPQQQLPISPTRAGAVWNRFFTNAAGTSEDPSQYASTSNSRAIEMSAAPTQGFAPATAVFDAVRKSETRRLHELLMSGVSPNVRDVGERGTPLHLAAEMGNLDAVMVLSEFGADLEIRDENGNTPLLLACAQSNFECTQFFLQSAANWSAVNADRDTALHLAAWGGSVECVEILLEYGLDPTAENALGLTALANLKTRSPMRHLLDDLASDHAMRKTIAILEQAQAAQVEAEEEEAERAASVPSETPGTHTDPVATSGHSSWGWLLPSVFGWNASTTKPNEADAGIDYDSIDDEVDEADETDADADRAFRKVAYAPLAPPPEIQAALQHHPPASQALHDLPPPPPDVLNALAQRHRGAAGMSPRPRHAMSAISAAR